MFALLWQANADRKQQHKITLLEHENTDSKAHVYPGHTYTFRLKTEGKTIRLTMLRVQEVAHNVFLLDLFRFDNATASCHKAIQIKLGEKSDRITLSDEFNAEQYGFSFTSGIYDLEGLNRAYFSEYKNANSIEVSMVDIYKVILRLLNQTFEGKLK